MIGMVTIRIILLLSVVAGLGACEKKPTQLRLAIPVLSVDQEIAKDFSELLVSESDIRIELTGSPVSDEAARYCILAIA